jgi:putative ABC transport system permease protein
VLNGLPTQLKHLNTKHPNTKPRRSMLRNYVKIALRTLWKQKGITAINVLGLAAGMAVCLLVGLLVWDQVTHDDFHPGADRLYRVTMTQHQSTERFATSPAGLAPVLRTEVTGIEAATRLRRSSENVVLDNQGYEAQSLYADSSFFDVFGFDLQAGNEQEALTAPYTAVITQDLARTLYGKADPMGKTVRLPSLGAFTVVGVLNRDEYRSHLAFDVLYSFATLQQERAQDLARDWERGFTYYTYLRLAAGRTPESIASTLRQIEEQYLPDPESVEGTPPGQFGLQAVSALPLSSPLMNELKGGGMLPATVGYFLAALALLVLLAAGFNYVNLSTARSLTRAREVGVRKTMGAHRQQVMGQFVAEAVVVSLGALGLALLLMQVLVPGFNQLSVVQDVGARIDVSPGGGFYAGAVGFALLVGTVAGLYPAWHLSKFQPARVLKASVQRETPGFFWMTPRRGLVVLQFAVAIIVIVTTALVYQQAQHMARTETTFRTEHLIQVQLQEAAFGPFQEEARQIPGVNRVAGAQSVPLSGSLYSASLQSDRIPEPLDDALYYAADYEFVEALAFPFVAQGEWSEAQFESGQTVVFNETAVRELGFASPQQALGQSLTLEHDTTRSVRVAGVVEDFQFHFLEDKSTKPAILHYNPSDFQVALAQVVPGQEDAALGALRDTWGRFDDTNPPAIRPYHDVVRERFVAPVADAAGILGLVAGLSVLISCLGLLGIATYTVQTRTREIGIRKALGATVPSIVGLLSADFLWLIGAAVVVGLPVAWGLNHLWLQNLAYRIEIGVWTFGLSAAAMTGLALLAIGLQTIRAAQTDPAVTLRDE